MTSCTILLSAAGPAPLALRLDGTEPVSIALITIDWKLAGMPSARSLPTRLAFSCELTSMPRTATPRTAPISRLVLVAEAAIPERSGGTADSAAEVTGTMVAPIPMPVRASVAASSA
jgi:hypothetical protein